MRVSSTSSVNKPIATANVAKPQQGNFQLLTAISRQYESNLTIGDAATARRQRARAAAK
jgi:hypothetical protein